MSKDLVSEKNPESSRGLVVIPCISSEPLDSAFDEAVERTSEGYSIVRINAWNSAEDLEKMTLKNLHDLIDQACESLKSNDCESITVFRQEVFEENSVVGSNNRFWREYCGKVEI